MLTSNFFYVLEDKYKQRSRYKCLTMKRRISHWKSVYFRSLDEHSRKKFYQDFDAFEGIIRLE